MKLIAGPFLGEFGHELFCWQGRLRRIAQDYDEVEIVCKKGHEILYRDFVDKIHIFDETLPDTANRWECIDYQYEDPFAGIKCARLLSNEPLIRYNWRNITQNELFYQQDFIEYGVEKEDLKYDILLHKRTTKKLNQNYKNKFDKWNDIVNYFKGFRIASIGSLSQSEHIKGTDDLRGITLEELADICRSSRVLVSPSSGPVHFASLCNCKFVTWFGKPIKQKGMARYVIHWNPFEVKQHSIYDVKWNPTFEQVRYGIEELIHGKMD